MRWGEQLQLTASESISYAQSRGVVRAKRVGDGGRGTMGLCVVSPLNIYFAHSFLLLRLPQKGAAQGSGVAKRGGGVEEGK